MSTRAILRALVVASVVGACSDPAEPPLPAFSVSPAMQWSGGTIAIRSPYFVDRDPTPVLTASAETLSVTRQDDSTLVATVPRGFTRTVTVFLSRGTRVDSIASLERVGFSDLRTQNGPGFSGLLEATDSAGKPLVFGAVSTDLDGYRAPIVRLKVVPGQSALLVPTLRQPDNAFYGMAPSVTRGVYAVRDTTDTLRMARLLDDVPIVTGTVPWIGTGGSRQVALLSDGIWLRTASHFSRTMREADTSMIVEVASESPYQIFMSPRGDRTTMATVVTGVDGGVPVFDNLTGTVAYRLPFRDIRVAAFSPDGVTMFVGGGPQYSADSLVAIDAATGTVQVPPLGLPDGLSATGMAYRASHNQLLVGATHRTPPGARATLYLLVYRASTLELLGVLPSPYECGEFAQGEECFSGVVTVHDASHKAYIVNSGSIVRILAFDLLSAP